MAEMETRNYITRQELEKVEQQVKRSWKTILVLLTLALRADIDVAVIKKHAPEKTAISEIVAKVLLIDTDPAASKELSSALANAGFEVITSLDPEEAMRSIQDVSIVIMDDELPRSEELCSRIRSHSNVPLILMGSESGGKAWNRAVAIGADAYLRKTINRQELIARMKTILRRYRAIT